MPKIIGQHHVLDIAQKRPCIQQVPHYREWLSSLHVYVGWSLENVGHCDEDKHCRNLTCQLTPFQTKWRTSAGNIMFGIECDVWHGSPCTPPLQGYFPGKSGEAQTKEFWQNRENIYFFILPVKRCHRPKLVLVYDFLPQKTGKKKLDDEQDILPLVEFSSLKKTND